MVSLSVLRSVLMAGLLAGTRCMLPCVLIATSGCAGYRLGGGYDREVRTVAVPMFGNETFDIGLEAQLTEAIAKEIQRATPWRITSVANADTVLSGSIVSSDLTLISQDTASGLVEEQGVRLTVRFDWRDQRTGQSVVSREGFSAVGSFVPALGVQERIETGTRDAVGELARDIVDLLRSDW